MDPDTSHHQESIVLPRGVYPPRPAVLPPRLSRLKRGGVGGAARRCRRRVPASACRYRAHGPTHRTSPPAHPHTAQRRPRLTAVRHQSALAVVTHLRQFRSENIRLDLEASCRRQDVRSCQGGMASCSLKTRSGSERFGHDCQWGRSDRRAARWANAPRWLHPAGTALQRQGLRWRR